MKILFMFIFFMFTSSVMANETKEESTPETTEVTRLYKRVDSKIKKELNFTTPKSTKLC